MTGTGDREHRPERLFADVLGADPNSIVERVVVWERLLEDGTRADLTGWLAGSPGGPSCPEIVAWLQRRGDRLSARSWAFWRWLLQGAVDADAELPARGDNPFWPDAAGSANDEAGSSDG